MRRNSKTPQTTFIGQFGRPLVLLGTLLVAALLLTGFHGNPVADSAPEGNCQSAAHATTGPACEDGEDDARGGTLAEGSKNEGAEESGESGQKASGDENTEGGEDSGFSLNGNIEDGREVYQTNCTTCHGPKGAGDGPAAAAFDPKPTDFTDADTMSKVSDRELYKAIEKGGAAVGKSSTMAAWGDQLSDQELMDVATYVRSLSK